jgi:hypothetical protein
VAKKISANAQILAARAFLDCLRKLAVMLSAAKHLHSPLRKLPDADSSLRSE